MLLIITLHLALTSAPGIAATMLALRRGIRDVPVLLGIGLAASGAAALLAFWAFFGNPLLGQLFAFGLPLGSLAMISWCWPAVRSEGETLRQVAIPWVLWVLGSVFLVSLGFLHGGTDHPLWTAAIRFSGQLPSDNDIPQYFANWIFDHGHHGAAPPFPPNWLSSDRPPLQSGFILAQRPVGWDTAGLHYQVLGVMLQQLWIVGLWALLCAARIRGVTRALAIVTALICDVAIVNGFFVWPKLLAAAFLLAALALVIVPERSLRKEPMTAVLMAALVALAFLAHGASVFAIIPLAGLVLLRGLPNWRWLAAGLATGFLLLAPWTAYQKYFDPPGNRLLKWQLAGVIDPDPRGTRETILDSYREAGIGGTIDNKARNVRDMTGGTQAISDSGDAVTNVASGDFSAAIAEVRNTRFLGFLPSLGLLIIAPFAMALAWSRARRDSDEWGFAVTCLAFTAAGCVGWGLLLFGSPVSNTVIHQGSLALPLLALCGCLVGLRAAWPKLANVVIGVNALLLLLIYVPYLHPGSLRFPGQIIQATNPSAGHGYSVVAALLVPASLAGFALLAFRADALARTTMRLPTLRKAQPAGGENAGLSSSG